MTQYLAAIYRRRKNQQSHGYYAGLLATVLFLWLERVDDWGNLRPEQLPMLDRKTKSSRWEPGLLSGKRSRLNGGPICLSFAI